MITKHLLKLNGIAFLLTTICMFAIIPKARALDVTATSCSRSDVESAIAQVEAGGGGTVYIPAGDCDWSDSSVTKVEGDVSIIGAGVGQTILQVTDGSDFFYFNYAGVGSSVFWRLSGITFYSDLGCTSGCKSSTAIQWRNTKNYRIDNNRFEGYFGALFEFKSCSKGLIDHNTFIHTNIAGIGYYGISAGMPYTGKPSDVCNTDICDCQAGEESEDRDLSVASGNTVISGGAAVIDNTGGAGAGTVRRIYVHIASVSSNPTINVASFSRSGNIFTARARTTGLSVAEGLNVFAVDNGDFTPFAINNGDYIGVYLNNAAIDVSSGSSGWTVSGDQTNQSNVDFGSPDVGAVSVWVELYDDEGNYESCESEWDAWWDDTTRGGGHYQGFNENWVYDENAHYIEDNTFDWYKTAVINNWGGGASFVVRHNTFQNSTGNVFTGMKPGGPFAIFHDNLFKYIGSSPPAGYAFRYRINGLVYNNTLEDMSRAGIWQGLRHYSGSYYFTWQARPKELHIWDNTYINAKCGTQDVDCWGSESANATFFWGEGDNGTLHLRAPQAGERLYGFTEYTYPHPLAGGVSQTCAELGGVECCDNVDYVCPDTAYSGASDCSGACCSVSCVPETTPPARSDGQPSTDLSSGTTQTTISLDTDETANCKYALSAGISYPSMTNTFTNTDATIHSTLVTGLSDGNTYSYYIRCNDTNGNYNTDDFVISFDVSNPDTTPPVISSVVSTPSSTSATITWDTDKSASSRVDYGLTTSYGLLEKDLTLKQSHSITLTNLEVETTYYYKITSVDNSGNSASYSSQFTTTTFSGWQTPVSIVSYCGQDGSSLATNFIDEDTDSVWHHWSDESHSIILDMGDILTITKIRLWHEQYGSSFVGIAEIYISENTTEWGESLGSLPEPLNNESSGWKEADIVDKNGRYIRLVSEVRGSIYWREFDANGSLVSSDTTLTISTPQNTWFNADSVPPSVDVNFSDGDGLDSAWYKVESAEAWMPIFSGHSTTSYITDFTVEGYAEGTNVIYFKVTDDSGNTYEPTTTDTLTIKVDVARPTGTIDIQ